MNKYLAQKAAEQTGQEQTPKPGSSFFGSGYRTQTDAIDLNPTKDIENEAIHNSSKENKILTDGTDEEFSTLDDAAWHDKLFGLDSSGKLIRKTVSHRGLFQEGETGADAQEGYETNRSIFGAIPILGRALTGENQANGYYPAKGSDGKYYLKKSNSTPEEMNEIGQGVMSAYGSKPFSSSFGTNLYKGLSRTLNNTDKLLANVLEGAVDLGQATTSFATGGDFKSSEDFTDKFAAGLRNDSKINDLTTSHAADAGIFSGEGFTEALGSGGGSLLQAGGIGRILSGGLTASGLFKSGEAISVLATMGAGAIVNSGEAYETAKAAKLSEEQAALFMFGVGAVNTLIEQKIGTNALMKYLARGGAKEVPTIVEKDLVGKYTAEAIDAAVPGIAKKISNAIFGAPVIGQGVEEGVEEFLQGASLKTAQALYDQFAASSTATPGKGKFGTDLTDEDTWKEIFGEALVGAVTGSIGGVATRRQNQTEFDTIVPYVARGDAHKAIDAINMLQNQGSVSEQQATAYKQRVTQLDGLFNANKSLFDGLDDANAAQVKGNALNAIEDEWQANEQITAYHQQIAKINSDKVKSPAIKEQEIAEINKAVEKQRDVLAKKTDVVRQYLPDSEGKIPAIETIKSGKPPVSSAQTAKQEDEDELKKVMNDAKTEDVIASDQAKDEAVKAANDELGVKPGVVNVEGATTPTANEDEFKAKETAIEKRREDSLLELQGKYKGEEYDKLFAEVNSQYDAEIKAVRTPTDIVDSDEARKDSEETHSLPDSLTQKGALYNPQAFARMQTHFSQPNGPVSAEQLNKNVEYLENKIRSKEKPDLHVKVQGKYFNIEMIGETGAPIQVGYLSPGTAVDISKDSLPGTKAAAESLEAIKKAIKESKFAPEIDYKINSSIDSGPNASGPQTTRNLLDLENRVNGVPTSRLFMDDGNYTIYQNKNGVIDAILGNLSETDIASTGFPLDHYVLKVQDPGGNTRFIGLETNNILDAASYTKMAEIINHPLYDDPTKTAKLNDLIFVASKNPMAWNAKFRVTKGDVNILLTNPENYKETRGYIRIPKNTPLNSFEDIAKLDTFSDNLKKSGMKVTDLISGFRTQLDVTINKAEDEDKGQGKDNILSKLIPTTTEQLWGKVYVVPTGIKNRDADTPPVKVTDAASKDIEVHTPGEGKTVKGFIPDAKQMGDQINGETFDAPFKISSTEKLQSTDFKQAEKNIKRILPDFITVKNMREIASQVYNNGSTLGAFWNDSIFLADLTTPGVEYHEAFHGVFRRLISESERSRLYAAELKSKPVTMKDIHQFKAERPSLAERSNEEIAQLILEERMADKFMDFMNNKPAGIFRKTFEYIKRFINWVKGNETDLRAIFDKIDAGAFRNSNVVLNSAGTQLEAYKLLPGCSAQESGRIINLATALYAQRILNPVKESDKTTYYDKYKGMERDEIIRAILVERREIESSDQAEYEANTRIDSSKNSALLGVYADGGKVYKNGYHDANQAAIIDQVNSLLAHFNVNDDVDEEGDTAIDRTAEKNDASERVHDQSIFEVGGFGSVSKDIKKFIELTVYKDADGVENVVDFFTTYSTMERRLSGIENWNEMLGQLQDLSENSLQIKAIYDNLHLQSANFKTKFQQAFSKKKAEYLQVVVNDKSGEYRVMNANRSDVGDIQLSNFKRNFDGMKEDVQKANATSAKQIVGRMKADTDTQEVISALASVGLTVTPAFIKGVQKGYDALYALDKHDTKKNLKQDLDQILTQMSKGINPFIDDTTNTGSVSRIKNVGEADAAYRDDIINSNFQNAEGKNVYTYIMPSHAFVTAEDIQKGKLDSKFMNDKWYESNPLIRMQKEQSTTLGKLKLFVFNGIREEASVEGVTFKNIDSKTNLLAQHSLFKAGFISPFVFEAKSTSSLIPLPKIDRFYEYDSVKQANGMSKLALDFMYGFVKQDLVMVDRALAEIENLGDDELIEGYHFGERKIGEDTIPAYINNKPNRMKPQEIKDEIARGNRSSLPRAFQIVQYPFLNKFTSEELTDAKMVKGELFKFFQSSLQDYKKLLIANDILIEENGKPGPDHDLLITEKDKKDYHNMDEYLGEFLLKDFIFANAYAQLHRGTEAKYKNGVDVTKRAAGQMAAGFPLLLEKTDFKVALLQDDEFILNPKTMARVAEPTEEQLKEGGYKNRKDFLKKNGYTDVNATDAQGYVSPTRFREILRGLGRLDPITEKKINQLIAGDEIDWNPDEFVANSIKNVYFDGEVYIKTSIFPLFRAFTSYKTVDGKWEAKPGLEVYHNYLEQMETNNIDELYHESAFKMVKKSKNFRAESGLYDTPLKTQTLQNRFWRLQVENPSGKTEIVDGTQLIQLIDSEMSRGETVMFKGEEKSLGDIRDLYQQMLAGARLDGMTKATNFLDVMVDGKSAFIDKIVSSLETSGTDNNTIEFFQQLAKNSKDFKYSTDLPNINNKFQELFLSHFTKSVFRQKAPGNKFSLVSAHGYMVEDSETKQMRPLKIHADVNGELQYAECVISEELLHNYGITRADLEGQTEEVQNEILTMLGFRIPTQSHHSMMPFKVVGWLPAYYGSVVIAPSEITYLSGADYDVDSLFVVRKEFRTIRAGAKKILDVYNVERTGEQLWDDYLAYEFSHNKDLKKIYSDLLLNDKEYQVIKSALANYKSALEEVKDTKRDLYNRTKTEDLTHDQKQEIHAAIAELQKVGGTTLAEHDFESFQQLLEVKLDTEDFFKEKALNLLKMVSTPEAFIAQDKHLQYTNAARYNAMLDARLAFLSNPDIRESLFTPASMDSLKKISKNIDAVTGNSEDTPIPYNWASSRFSHWLNNAVGKANVGNAANSNLVSALLTKYKTGLNEPIIFDGITYHGFVSNDEIDIDFTYDKDGKPSGISPKSIIRRKADSLSTLVSAMTDNAKERLAAKLNLTSDNLSVFANMVGMGMGLNRVMLFANQPIMKTLTQKMISANSIVRSRQSSFELASKVQFELKELMTKNGIEAGYLKITSAQMLDSLSYSVEDLIDTLQDTATLTEDKEKVGERLNFQLAVLDSFIQFQELSNAIAKITKLMSTNKSVGINFAEFDAIIEANKIVRGEHFPLNVYRVLNEEENIKENISNVKIIEKVAPEYFLSRTKAFRTIMDQTLAQGVKKDSVSKATTDFVTFLGMQNLNKVLKAKFGKDVGEHQYLLEGDNNIVVQYTEILAKNPELEKNLLMKQLIPRNPDTNKDKNQFYRLEFNGRSNTDPKFIEKLADSYKELTKHASPEVRKFSGEMMKYLIVKDNLKFMNNSFIRLIDPQFLDTYSQTLKAVKSIFTKEGKEFRVAFKDFYGKSVSEMNTLFQEEYFSNIEHAGELKQFLKKISPKDYSFTKEGLSIALFDTEDAKMPKFFRQRVKAHNGNPAYNVVWQQSEVTDQATKYTRLHLNGNKFQQPFHKTDKEQIYTPINSVKPVLPEGPAKGTVDPKTSNQELQDKFEAKKEKVSKDPSDYTNYSGAAQGSDTEWEKVGEEYSIGKQVNYKPETLQKLTEAQRKEVETAYLKVVKTLNRKPLDANTYAGGLVRRDYLQAKAADAVFAIIEDFDTNGYVKGGTAYAVVSALNMKKPVYVFNQAEDVWYVADYGTDGEFENWTTTSTPILTPKYAGIGTRQLKENGKKAIRDVYENTFSGEKSVESLWNTHKDRILKKDPKATLENLIQMANSKGIKWLEEYIKKCH